MALRRGYHTILLRDCTNGMETDRTYEAQLSRHGTVAFLEQIGM